jgi:hypothetical protein
MTTVTRTYLVDDLDGSQDDVENVLLALDGTNYEIDLSASNAARLRDKLARFVARSLPSQDRREVRADQAWPRRQGSHIGQDDPCPVQP